MTSGEIEIFADSFDRCMADERVFDLFYDRFVASSPAVAERFAHTDDRRQKRAVRASLYLIMSCTVRSEADYSPLRPLAERHSRHQLDIGPELYRLWLDSLIEEGLARGFSNRPEIASRLRTVRQAVAAGQIPASTAADELLALFFGHT